MSRMNSFYTTEVAARAIGFKSIDASSFARCVRVEWRAGTRKYQMRGAQIKNYYQETFRAFLSTEGDMGDIKRCQESYFTA